MTMIIQDDNGNDIEVFTAEEVAAKAQADAQAAADAIKAELEAKHQAELAEKDTHLKSKLDEFVKGKKNVDSKEEELNTKMEEIKRIAEEANQKVTQAEIKKNETIKEFWISQTVGSDADLTAKLKAAYDMVNMEVADEKDIATRVKLAANMIGISSMETPSFGISGGVAPQFPSAAETKSKIDDETFRKELGLELPKA